MTISSEKNKVGIIKTWKRIHESNKIFSFITKESTGYYLCFGSPTASSNECIRFRKLKDAMVEGEKQYFEYAANVARFHHGVR